MKRLIFSLLAAVVVIATVSCGDGQTTEVETHRAEMQTMVSAPLSPLPDIKAIPLSSHVVSEEAFTDVEQADTEEKATPEPEQEEFFLSDKVPLSEDEQKALQSACKEFDIPYALALGLIERETHFQNVVGDDGASTGYMQIQVQWHYDRMERLGVTDLSDPTGNFRVGCDLLSELYEKYGSWDMALTVYNMGHDPGYITNYAYDILNKYEVWIGVVGTNE